LEQKDKAVTMEEHFQLAFKAEERGNLEEAVSEYQKVLKIDPKQARAHLNLGIVTESRGNGKGDFYTRQPRDNPDLPRPISISEWLMVREGTSTRDQPL
jgi:tetratricopeptide (TPR) repeat protein